MDFSGSNRGFCFVRYTDREHAKRAVKELNNFEIRPNKFLGILHSVDNRKLWVSGIPRNLTSDQIMASCRFNKCDAHLRGRIIEIFAFVPLQAEMQKLTDGVRDVILYSSQTDKSRTRGYAFVEYESHRAAALARRKLVPQKFYLGGQGSIMASLLSVIFSCNSPSIMSRHQMMKCSWQEPRAIAVCAPQGN